MNSHMSQPEPAAEVPASSTSRFPADPAKRDIADEPTVPGPDRGHRPKVVVGIDGSVESGAALRWAIRYAEATDGAVVAVTAWQYPATFGYAPLWTLDFQAMAEGTLDAVVDRVLLEGQDLQVERRAMPGEPARVLLREAEDADLLVLGNRGQGAVSKLLLGSVTAECARHARCPTVVVPVAPSGTGDLEGQASSPAQIGTATAAG